MSASENNVIVEAVGLKKIFKDFWNRPKAVAVNGVDFEIRQGEVIGLLGPNGSGKSTTVKMFLGLLYPTSGKLTVFDKAPNDVRTKSRIGYLPEETYLYKYLTAAETLDFFGALFNQRRKERDRRTQKLLEMVGLGHSTDRPVGEFSKGMARRIGLAQSLINDPDLLILDEPTSGLDPIGCNDVKNLIRELARRKKTVILCSHLLADVEDVCDRVMVMYGGRIRAEGRLSDLLTVEDKTRITTPTLSADVLERVMAILNEAAGPESYTVDHPTINLESFFMDVVRLAQEASVDTSGVRESGAIASFLSEAEEKEKATQEVLEVLARPAEKPASAPPEEAEESVPEKEPDLDRLAELTESEAIEPKKPNHETPADNAEKSAEDKAEESSRIQDLLNRD